MTSARCFFVSLCLAVGSFFAAASAHAYPGGVAASGCGGCHQGGSFDPSLDFALSPASFEPGDEVTATLGINAEGASGAGVWVFAGKVGTLTTVSGQGLSPRSDGLAHTSPKTMNGGRATFQFRFRAPDSPGTVGFEVYALVTNGGSGSRGDSAVSKTYQFAFGCEGQPYYYDADQDGYGRDSLDPKLACAGQAPESYSDKSGDCRDFDEDSYPGATEICDLVDNNCDGQIDENADPVELWPDRDGDGYYDVKEGEPLLGCVGLSGYAAEGGDCRGDDPAVHPGAEELCNFQDEDCDGSADEGVKPTCGEGWCRRESTGCSEAACMPGAPSPETCNYIDDDCDGQTDEDGDALCAAGEHCVEGRCSSEAPQPGDGASEDGASEDGASGDGAQASPASSGGGCSTSSHSDALGLWCMFAMALLGVRRRRSPD